MPRRSAWTRLQDHFHTHPKGRLHEYLFWTAIGLVFGLVAFAGWRGEWMSAPIALILAIISVCFLGWAFLPPTPRPAAPTRPAKSKRRK